MGRVIWYPSPAQATAKQIAAHKQSHTTPIGHIIFIIALLQLRQLPLLFVLANPFLFLPLCQFVDLLQNVQKGTCTPRLRRTRVMTERPVLVRQLGKSGPWIIADISSRSAKDAENIV